MAETPTITISGTAYRVVTQLADTPTHRSFRVESEGRSYLLKVFRKEAAPVFDKQIVALAKVKAHSGLLLPIESGEFNDERFVLRGWVEGESFDVYTRRFKFNPKRLDVALAIGEQLARAVAALHEQGTAHGRLKNENVFFDNDYDPVVTDPSGAGDPRDDVRQIGLLLCRLYTRKPTLAINSRTLMELSKAKVPMNLLKVLWQAIQEQPSERFKDAGTLATALQEVPLKDHEKTVHVRAVPKAKGVQDGVDPRLKWGLVAAVLISIVGVGGFLIGRSSNSATGKQDATISSSNQEPIRPRYETTRLTSGVTYYDIEVGTGPLVTSTEPVSIRIISRESEVFPLSDLDLQSMLHGLSRMRTNQYAAQNLGEPKSREGIPGMRRGGIRAIGLENRMMPKGNRDNWARNRGEPLPDEGWTTILVEVLDTPPGVRITDLQIGNGEVLHEGDISRIRFRALRVTHDGHVFTEWKGEVETNVSLSNEGALARTFWGSFVGMREGGRRRFVVASPSSDSWGGIRNGQFVELPVGTVWEYEVDAISTQPWGRSRTGISLDVASPLVGAVVLRVVGDPARRAGLAPGDIIQQVGGETIASGRHAFRLLVNLEPEVPVDFVVSRNGAALTLTVVPEHAPPFPQGPPVESKGAIWIGTDLIEKDTQ